MRIVVTRHTVRRVLVHVVLAASSPLTAAATAATTTPNAVARAFGFLLPYSVHAGAGVDVVVDGPVGAFAAVGEWSGDLLEAGVEREIVSDGVLEGSIKM